MSLDVAIVGFTTQNGAVNAFTKRAGDDAAWTNEVAFVEHHRSGRVALSGTFAGHYLDVDEVVPDLANGARPAGTPGSVTSIRSLTIAVLMRSSMARSPASRRLEP